jgi:hypothetical protein
MAKETASHGKLFSGIAAWREGARDLALGSISPAHIMAILLSLWPAFAMGRPTTGFTFCARPYRPPCASILLKNYPNSACEEQVKAYIASVFRYRECLEKESERAVRESNELIDMWKCKRLNEGCQN